MNETAAAWLAHATFADWSLLFGSYVIYLVPLYAIGMLYWMCSSVNTERK